MAASKHMSISVDWSKLKSYKSDKRRSFEELCFQIAYENHAIEGTFVPVDDSGGGSGVEFYQRRSDGSVWGWQAKFHPSGRFTPSRRAAVQKSLTKSLRDHENLTRWHLCSPLDLTTQGKYPQRQNGFMKRSKGAPQA